MPVIRKGPPAFQVGPFLLLVAQRVDRVEVCCLAGRIETEEDADGAGEEHGDGEYQRVYDAADAEQGAEPPGCTVAVDIFAQCSNVYI